MIIAIDPGPTDSAYCVLRCKEDVWSQCTMIGCYGKGPNHDVLARLSCVEFCSVKHLVIEQVASYGMPVGEDVFETVFWSGRFAQAWAEHGQVHRIKRHEVKMHLCHSTRAKDSNIRQALIDRLGPVGTKKQPGPCYGLSGDVWAAVAVGVTWIATHTQASPRASVAQARAIQVDDPTTHPHPP